MLRLSEYRMMLASIMSSVSSIAFEFLIQCAKLQKSYVLRKKKQLFLIFLYVLLVSYFTKTTKTLSSGLKLFQSLCAKCYVLVFKSELLRQFHITFHIHYRGSIPRKQKPRFFEPKKQ